jgi:hypothetical protein
MSEKLTRKVADRALERVFSRPAPPSFDTMTEDEIMEFADREIAAYRKEQWIKNGETEPVRKSDSPFSWKTLR